MLISLRGGLCGDVNALRRSGRAFAWPLRIFDRAVLAPDPSIEQAAVIAANGTPKALVRLTYVRKRASMPRQRIIAVGLLTEQDLDRLGATFTRLWPVENAPCFEELLAAIDEAETQLQEDRREKPVISTIR